MKTKFSIKKKLMVGFGALCVITVLQGLLSMFFLGQIRNEHKALMEYEQVVNEVSDILVSHHNWVNGITLAVYTGDEFTGSLDPDTCSLGQWLNSEYVASITDEELVSLVNAVQEPHRTIHQAAAELMERTQAGTISQAETETYFLDVIKPNSLASIGYLRQILGYEEQIVEGAGRNVERFISLVMVGSILSAVLCLGFAVAAMIILVRKIVPPLLAITDAAEAVAQGRTNVNLSIKTGDEIELVANAFGHMQDATMEQVQMTIQVADGDFSHRLTPRSPEDSMSLALNKLVESMERMIVEISASASQVSIGARQMSEGAQSLAIGATQQASAVDELSRTISQVAEKTDSNTEIANRAAQLGENIKENAEKGSGQMEHLMQAVQEINQASGAISKVIKVIDDIAFQTNILSLNAAVEAARAGQHGKGFAVVADEVRNLAAKSAEAAKDTGDLINNSISKAELGSRIARETSESLADIVSGIMESSQIVEQIAASSREQAVAINQINQGIEQVANVIQQNSSTAQQSAASSEEMSSQAAMLSHLIQQFVTRSDIAGQVEGLIEQRPEEIYEADFMSSEFALEEKY